MSGFVYIWLDKKHRRYYLGSHWGSIDDGYVCSSTWMKRAHAIRPHDFKRRIISTHEDRKEMREREYELLSFIRVEELGKKYYNLSRKAPLVAMKQSTREKLRIASTGRKLSPEARLKCKIARSKQIITEEHKKKIGIANTGKKHTEETKKIIGDKSRGRPQSEETRRKRSIALKGRKGHPLSLETREKLRQHNLGKKRTLTEEARAKISAANKGKTRKPFTDEHRQKIREAALRQQAKRREMSS